MLYLSSALLIFITVLKHYSHNLFAYFDDSLMSNRLLIGTEQLTNCAKLV